MRIALITIKRGIYSKPIKKYIDSLLARLRAVDKHCYQSAMSYHLTQETALYGQKKGLNVDVIC